MRRLVGGWESIAGVTRTPRRPKCTMGGCLLNRLDRRAALVGAAMTHRHWPCRGGSRGRHPTLSTRILHDLAQLDVPGLGVLAGPVEEASSALQPLAVTMPLAVSMNDREVSDSPADTAVAWGCVKALVGSGQDDGSLRGARVAVDLTATRRRQPPKGTLNRVAERPGF